MKLLIWEVSNVGKTTVDLELAKRLNYNFYNIDDEIIEMYGGIDNFQEIFSDYYDRFDEKKKVILDIINREKNFIIAVSSIFSASVIKNILFTDTMSIEIIDTPESIYDRLILKVLNLLNVKKSIENIICKK